MIRNFLRLLNTPFFLIFILIGISLQTSLFTSWPWIYLQPNIILIGVLWCALRRNFLAGGVCTLILSEIREIHSVAPQGLFLISDMIIFLVLRIVARFFVIPSFFSYSLLTTFSCIAWKLINITLIFLLSIDLPPWKNEFTLLLFDTLMTSLFSIWIYPCFERIDQMTFQPLQTQHFQEVNLPRKGF